MAVQDNVTIWLDRASLVLDPTADELVGPEAACLSGWLESVDGWIVWRPGEAPFEHLAG